MTKFNCGKWILSGEHSVLRGSSSFLFPMKDMTLSIEYTEGDDFSCVFSSEFSPSHSSIFEQAIKTAFNQVNQKPIGIFSLKSDIPLGFGLGSSAAFCLSLSQIFFEQSWISDILEFAIELEGVFHGKSSGADIYVSYYKNPILFQKEGIKKLKPSWAPPLYLYNTKVSSLTKECVNKVNLFIEKFPKEGRLLDQQMSDSVQLAIQSITQDHSLEKLIQSIQKAYDCFNKWGLLENIESHIESLQSKKALAVKPTGAGRGGFILALFEKPLSLEQEKEYQLISLRNSILQHEPNKK